MRTVTILVLLAALVGCGSDGGGSSSGSGSGGTGQSGSSTLPVSVAVSGLASGSSVTLSDNGTDSLTVTKNGSFTFNNALASGAAYSISITNQPTAATCTVTNGSGTVAVGGATIAVSCIGPFQVGGTVSGLSSGLQITLIDNGSDTLTLSADGSFNFATGIAPGGSYSVAIPTPPSGEQCSIQNSAGSVATASVTSIVVTCGVPTLRLLAGALGGTGNADGSAASARFDFPTGVAIDTSGTLYISDTYNATVRKLDSSGVVTTLAGKAGQSGSADGVGTAARFNDPDGLTVDQSGTIYVSDAGANTVRRVAANGTVRTLAGTAYSSGTMDGSGAAAQFTNPSGIQISPSGSLYLVDQNRIRNITMTGDVTTLYTAATQLYGIAIESASVVLATDLGVGIGRDTVDRIDLSAATDTVLASGLQNPTGIAIAPSGSSAAGTVYVSDEFNGVVDEIDAGNTLTVLAGSAGPQTGNADGTGTAAQFWAPNGMAIDQSGNLYVADSGNNEVRKVTPAGVVTTIAGAAAQSGEIDNTGAAARFSAPGALVVDPSGNLYVGEIGAIREVTPSGVVTHALSAGLPAPLSVGQGFALDSAGNFYFAVNDTILEMSTSGAVTTLAGFSSVAAYLDGAGAMAFFNSPLGVALDATGNVYVADTRNRVIRKVTPGGVVTTVAGRPGDIGSADGSSSVAQFTNPVAITIDPSGTLYIVDGNAIRTISPAGVVTTVAGSQAAGSADGTGAAAQFNGPTQIALGTGGSLYVSDTLNNEIRKITATGVVTTIAGLAGVEGVALGTLPASLNSPTGVAYIGTTLYVADSAENCVLEITNVP
jgi:sugar lactone lactonase YvrE